jgi:Di-haem oxidoreductase, putative peroxidase
VPAPHPSRGIFNRLFATAATRFVAIDDGAAHPLVLPEGEPFVVKNLFADFKRHDLGPAFHEREYDGTRRTEFLTEALWGIDSTAPYGHDGRSINLEEVILRHGGEAKASRDTFARLTESERREILDFLATLVLFPPDGRARDDQPRRAVPDPGGGRRVALAGEARLCHLAAA